MTGAELAAIAAIVGGILYAGRREPAAGGPAPTGETPAPTAAAAPESAPADLAPAHALDNPQLHSAPWYGQLARDLGEPATEAEAEYLSVADKLVLDDQEAAHAAGLPLSSG